MARDSRLRVIQRENGRVFVVWFGGIYASPEMSKLRVGDEVELMEGSTKTSVVLRSPNRGIVESGWVLKGVQGGIAAKPRWEKEWEKFLAGEKSHDPKKDVPKEEAPKNPSRPGLPNMVEIRALANDFEMSQINRGTVVRFRTRELASSFRAAALKKGWKAALPVTDDSTGDTLVLVNSV